MWSVLMLFLIPVGGGIPAGVLLASRQGIAWPVTAALYFVSDLILAVLFEPVLRVLAAVGRRLPIVARFGAAMGHAMERAAARHIGAGPFALILVAFGVDPMTGRAAALASGHGFVRGWAIAIAGDMLYYAVIAITTLQLGAYVHNPDVVMLTVLAAMILVPMVVQRIRHSRQLSERSADHGDDETNRTGSGRGGSRHRRDAARTRTAIEHGKNR